MTEQPLTRSGISSYSLRPALMLRRTRVFGAGEMPADPRPGDLKKPLVPESCSNNG